MNNVQKLSFVSLMHDFVRTQAQNHYQDLPKQLPCHISAIKGGPQGTNGNSGDFYELTFDIANSIFTLPKIIVPQTFSKYTREPSQVGDKGFIPTSSIFLGGESGIDGSTASLYQRGNLTTGAFQPVSSTKWNERDPNKFYHTGGPTGYIARSSDEKSAYMHIDQNNNINHVSLASLLHSAEQGIMHVAGNSLQSLLPGLPNFPGLPNIPGMGSNPLQGITHIAEQGILHVADAALQGVTPGQATSGITHLAQNAISHTSLNGITTIASIAQAINLVPGQGLTIGAPSSAYRFSMYDTPTPSQPTNVSVLGNVNATINISAGGSISAAGGMTSGGAAVMTEPVPPELVNAPVIVTGAKGGNTALASLIAALVTLGLIVDQTTA